MWNRRHAGVTLVELIVAMVIIGVALAGTVAVFARTTRASADPVVTQQMVAVAENLMEEILLKPYPAQACPSATAATARTAFADLCAYNGYGAGMVGIKDVEGNAITGLEAFAVNVAVAPVALTGVTQGNAMMVTVTVTDAVNPVDYKPYALTGWRTHP